MSEVWSWVAVLAAPFVAAWCVLEGRGLGAVIAILTGAMAYLAYVVAAGSVFGLSMSGSMAVLVWAVGVVALLLMRRNVNRIGVFVCKLTGAPVPPRVGGDLRKIPVEQLIEGFNYPKEAMSGEAG